MTSINETIGPILKKNKPFLHRPGSQKNYFCAHRSTSMNQTLNRQDILEIADYQERKPVSGDVILFLPPDGTDYFVHRIAHSGPDGFLTKGDNNNDIDPWTVQNKNIRGRVIAAYTGDRRRTIAGGFTGRMTAVSCSLNRKIEGLLIKLFRPFYRSLCTGGNLNRLVPFRLTPQVATYRSGSDNLHKLILGKREIGSYDESLLQWQIKRPYRLFVDESSLPTP
jgi:signal peptidase